MRLGRGVPKKVGVRLECGCWRSAFAGSKKPNREVKALSSRVVLDVPALDQILAESPKADGDDSKEHADKNDRG